MALVDYLYVSKSGFYSFLFPKTFNVGSIITYSELDTRSFKRLDWLLLALKFELNYYLIFYLLDFSAGALWYS